MCGITGVIGADCPPETLAAMIAAIAHRGPDGTGTFRAPERRVALGHARLSVIDIATGAQPMWNAQATVGVVFNGEIYNHAELRSQLEAKGHRFASDHSDTEVLIHGWAEWGEALPTYLNGMFAFAITDLAAGKVFLARDRFGEKPLYLADLPGGFAFGSEVAALLAHPGVGDAPCDTGLAKYLAHGFIPAPFTHLAGVKKLPAGCQMTFDLATGQRQQSQYRDFTLAPVDDRPESDLIDELDHLLVQATRRRLMADVPLGMFLSGGLDSSLILSCLGRAGAGAVESFTIGFNEPSFDESAFAEQAARHLGASHRLEVFSVDDARDLIEPVLRGMSEPLSDASILPTWQLSRFVRRHVTVALSGDGGDELFAGYAPFRALATARRLNRLPGALIGAMARATGRLPASARYMSLDFKARRFLLGQMQPMACRTPAWMAPLQPDEISRLTGREWRAEDLYSEAISAWNARPDLSDEERMVDYFTRFYLPDDILMKTDRAAMAHGLESRAVFLDNDLADFAERLPMRFKMRGGVQKYLLKKVAERHLPRDLVHRSKKGFGIPVARWLRDTPKVVPDAPIGRLDPALAQEYFAAHRAGKADHRLFLFAWLALQYSYSRGGVTRETT
ncbi:asparagine synthase (glutamine-hydrolyzing) [Oceaniglobus trochenteri]|uniref:asparagine synthase (glutamine-hydrolyzing) n=1 Tax=Oceaniglobus trochenteri TaxID=2763260 RepID=UPI001D000670|nr:asparagine synthase (glutamine-hydrolyzing) [Oceaniglobus trochenteri]